MCLCLCNLLYQHVQDVYGITYSKNPERLENFAFVIFSLFAKDVLIYLDITLQ